jgi:hypothetical protein
MALNLNPAYAPPLKEEPLRTGGIKPSRVVPYAPPVKQIDPDNVGQPTPTGAPPLSTGGIKPSKGPLLAPPVKVIPEEAAPIGRDTPGSPPVREVARAGSGGASSSSSGAGGSTGSGISSTGGGGSSVPSFGALPLGMSSPMQGGDDEREMRQQKEQANFSQYMQMLQTAGYR